MPIGEIQVDPATITLVGVGAIPLVVMLVQVAKIFGLPRSLAGAAAILFGFAVMGMVIAWQMYPEAHPWIIFVVGGIQIGLAAAGAYSQLSTQANTKAADKGLAPVSGLPAVPPAPPAIDQALEGSSVALVPLGLPSELAAIKDNAARYREEVLEGSGWVPIAEPAADPQLGASAPLLLEAELKGGNKDATT